MNLKGGLNSYDVDVIARRYSQSGSNPAVLEDTTTYTTTTQVFEGFKVEDNVPKIKVIDFIKGLFKTFNLIAYKQGSEIVVKSLNDFYNTYNTYDITKYCNVDLQVNRNEPFSYLRFKHKEAKTFLTINRNEILGTNYGELEYDSAVHSGEDNAFDGGSYNIDTPFEPIMFEKLIDFSTEAFTDYRYAALVDKDLNPTNTSPILFFSELIDVTGQTYEWDNDGTSLSTIYCPLQVVTDAGVDYQLNFNNELDLEGNATTDGLYSLQYQDYISNIYNPQSRIIKITAMLPDSILLQYNLNDRFIIHNRRYLINSIKTNLMTGKSELELITDNYGNS